MPTRPPTMPYVWFYGLWWGLLPLWRKNRKLVELRLRTVVPIRIGLGTMAVLVGSVVLVASVRNFTGVVLGTWYIFIDIFADFLWSASDDI